jgi:hypothetical protein
LNGRRSYCIAFALMAVADLVAAGLWAAFPARAATVTLPDMQIKVPTNQISIGNDPTTGHRMLRFTHITWDVGTGPFEIDPTYNSATGTATFVQSIYNSPSSGVWSFDHTVPISVTGVFDPPDDYRFPLTSFTLNTVNSDGSPGAVVATSPKTDYCIVGDTYVGGVPNTPNGTFIPASNCEDPTKPLGWSVGWGDEYDQTDSGQPIDLTGVADGTYVLHATLDPQHVLTESDATNNVTDTTLQISGSTVSVLSQTMPTTSPPAVSVMSPASGSNVSGTVTLQATAVANPPATISSVQFLLDGQPLGSPATASPYTYNWTVGSTSLGSHIISARSTDSNGIVGTSQAVPVNVISSNSAGVEVDQSVSATGTGTATTDPFSTAGSADTLVAFVSSDGAGSGGQTATVSGAGLTWNLVKRTNTRPGDAEMWKATASAPLSNATVTARLGQAAYSEQLTVLAFTGSAGVGASALAAAASGGPSVSLTSTAAGSLSYAVGNDYDTATPRTLGSGQTMVSQWVNAHTGDTYWVQSISTPSTASGQAVTLNDTAPTADQWNFAAVEILPGSGSQPPPDTTPPTVSITNPTPGQTISGSVPVAANASDNVAMASVQFFLDGSPLGNPVTTAPYAVNWDTTTATNGSHTLSAKATDTSGNVGTSTNVAVTVQNPAPPMTCFVLQAQVSAHGSGTVTTPSFHTAMAGETIFAFASADGPAGAGKQTVTVTGAGLTWQLVKRANAQSGDSEVWAATANTILSSATVTSTELKSGYAQDLTVIAMEGTSGVGASVAASGSSGAPTVSLTTTKATSLVFAVGTDWDRAVARTLPTGWVILDQWVDTAVGDTYWSQYTNQTTGPAGSVVTASDTAPTNDRWNMVAVELVNSGT